MKYELQLKRRLVIYRILIAILLISISNASFLT